MRYTELCNNIELIMKQTSPDIGVFIASKSIG